MKWKSLLPVVAVFLFASCDKDGFQTKPQIKVKSVNSNVVPVNGNLLINLEFTDKEGDLRNSEYIVIRNRVNQRPITQPQVNDRADTIRGKLPDFPKHTIGELQLSLGYTNFLKEDPVVNDTIIFRIAVSDQGGNKSDTISSERIVVLK